MHTPIFPVIQQKTREAMHMQSLHTWPSVFFVLFKHEIMGSVFQFGLLSLCSHTSISSIDTSKISLRQTTLPALGSSAPASQSQSICPSGRQSSEASSRTVKSFLSRNALIFFPVFSACIVEKFALTPLLIAVRPHACDPLCVLVFPFWPLPRPPAYSLCL